MVAQCNICGAVLGAGNQGHKEVNGDTSIIRCDDCQASFVKFQRKKKIKVNPLTGNGGLSGSVHMSLTPPPSPRVASLASRHLSKTMKLTPRRQKQRERSQTSRRSSAGAARGRGAEPSPSNQTATPVRSPRAGRRRTSAPQPLNDPLLGRTNKKPKSTRESC